METTMLKIFLGKPQLTSALTGSAIALILAVAIL